jgi:dolichyl-phosphate-mannose--protein O-mannosyl transferase
MVYWGMYMVKSVGDFFNFWFCFVFLVFFFFSIFSFLFLVSMLTVSAGKSKELQLPKDETTLTCFVVEKEKQGNNMVDFITGFCQTVPCNAPSQ